MTFGMTAAQFLQIARDQLADFRSDALCLRKAISCCVFLNHLPEHVLSEHIGEPTRTRGATKLDDYRLALQTAEPALLTIRDLCDYAKHGPTLGRASVRVDSTGSTKQWQLDSAALMMGIPNHHEVDKLVITFKDGTQRWLEAELDRGFLFWDGEFSAKGL